MTKTAQISILLTSFLFGCFVVSFFSPIFLNAGISPWFLIGVLFLIIFFWWQYNRLAILLPLCLILGGIYYLLFLPIQNPSHVSNFFEQEVETEGWIVQEPEREMDRTNYYFQPLSIQSKDKKVEKPQGRILVVSQNQTEKYYYGQKIKFKTKIIQPKSDGDFNYQAYLTNKGTYGLAYPFETKELGPVNQQDLGWRYYPTWLKEKLLALKEILLKSSQKYLAEPFQTLLAGLLFGQKTGLPDKLNDDFIKTGLIHIIVVSGYNISILIKIFSQSTKKWLPQYSFWLGSLSILLFVLMVGGSPPAVRAGIMAWIILVGRERGREANTFLLLVFTAWLMALFNPKLIRYDLGFQLSFLAVFGLIYFSPIMERWLKKTKKYLPKIGQTVLVETLSAQILTFPLILYTFGRISLIAPLANLLVLPVIPWAMGVGFLTSLAGLIIPILGQIIGWLERIILGYIIQITEGLASISWSSIELKWFNIYLLIASYLIILWLVYEQTKTEKE